MQEKEVRKGGPDTGTAISGSGTTGGKAVRKGLTFRRYFTKPGVHPFDEIEWELRSAVIANERGETIFEQKDV